MSKPARNKPCPCGSGNKYKKCCGTTNADVLFWILNVADPDDDWTVEELEYWRKQGDCFPIVNADRTILEFPSKAAAMAHAMLHFPSTPFEALPVTSADLPTLLTAVEAAEQI